MLSRLLLQKQFDMLGKEARVLMEVHIIVLCPCEHKNLRHVCAQPGHKGCHNSVPGMELRIWQRSYVWNVPSPNQKTESQRLTQLTVNRTVLSLQQMHFSCNERRIPAGWSKQARVTSRIVLFFPFFNRHCASVCFSFSPTVWTMWRLCTTSTAPTYTPAEREPSIPPVLS